MVERRRRQAQSAFIFVEHVGIGNVATGRTRVRPGRIVLVTSRPLARPHSTISAAGILYCDASVTFGWSQTPEWSMNAGRMFFARVGRASTNVSWPSSSSAERIWRATTAWPLAVHFETIPTFTAA